MTRSEEKHNPALCVCVCVCVFYTNLQSAMENRVTDSTPGPRVDETTS